MVEVILLMCCSAFRYQKEEEDREREALMSRRFTANDSSDTSIMIDAALQHNNAMHRAHRGQYMTVSSETESTSWYF